MRNREQIKEIEALSKENHLITDTLLSSIDEYSDCFPVQLRIDTVKKALTGVVDAALCTLDSSFSNRFPVCFNDPAGLATSSLFC